MNSSENTNPTQCAVDHVTRQLVLIFTKKMKRNTCHVSSQTMKNIKNKQVKPKLRLCSAGVSKNVANHAIYVDHIKMSF